MVEFGTPNCGLFQRLKASARNWKYFVSEIGRFLNKEVSQVEIPGFWAPASVHMYRRCTAEGRKAFGSSQWLIV